MNQGINWKRGAVIGLIFGIIAVILPRFSSNLVVDLVAFYGSYVAGLILTPLSFLLKPLGGAGFGFLSLLYSILPLIGYVLPATLIGYFLQKKNYIAVGVVILIFLIPLGMSAQRYFKTVYPQKMYNLAMKTNDVKYCHRISDQTKQGECLNHIGQLSKDLSVCSTITDPQLHDACAYNIAIGTVKYGACKEISAELCQKSLFLCDNVIDEKNRKDCKRYMLGKFTRFQQQGIIDNCKDSSLLSEYKARNHDECIFNITENTFEPDLSFCELITNQDIKTKCRNLPAQ